MNAPEMAEKIDQNADAYWERRITYETFTATAESLWRKADELGIVEDVRGLLRVNQRSGGPKSEAIPLPETPADRRTVGVRIQR